ncbi:uncharacterized protein LOC121834812 [Ixodes scapularis]|uniref:uncharacterized protein LOC121834812 n=1 Tax=Ixodes scapularis TaxID=6945 RepID=UPI001C38C2C9|nr:uncharacterized protein LOC121834812 [Ixodes scapularis]
MDLKILSKVSETRLKNLMDWDSLAVKHQPVSHVPGWLNGSHLYERYDTTRSHIQKFHRVFATFIWSSNWEPTRRDNLFRPIDVGGLGLIHIFLKQVISRFLFFKTASHHFLRTYLQTELASALPYLVVTTIPASTSRPVGYLKEVVSAIEFLTARFSLEHLFTVSRKVLYADLIDITFPEPLYRSIYSEGPGKDVLRRVRKLHVSPTAKSFFFKLHTSTLPVKPWLRERGIFVPWSINCRLCNQPETIEHCFIFCTDAYLFWDVLQRTLKKDLNINAYTIRFLPLKLNDSFPYDLFTLMGLHSLWKTRMIDRNADPPRSTKSNFIETVTHVRNVFNYLDERPDWYVLFDRCINLPDF